MSVTGAEDEAAREALAVLRARDFWGALVLIGLSVFFLWRTSFIPFLGENRAGVSGADWYNSAAIVPFGIWMAMLMLGFVLLRVAIQAGGAARALSAVGIGWDRAEALRIASIAVIMVFFIFSLVPRVDFILASGLVITAFIFGFHDGKTERMLVAAGAVAVAGAYALIAHFPQAEWNTPHDDDWVTLAALGGVDPVDAQPRQKPGCAGDPVDCAADAVGFGLCDGVRVSPKCAEPRRPAVFAD